MVAADDELEALISQVFKFRDAHQVDYIQLKTLHKSKLVEESGSFTPCFDQKTHILDLRPGLEMVRKKLHRTRISRFLSRSEKHGIEVRRASSLGELRLFYDLLLKSRKRIGLPPQYFNFFFNIWSLLSPAGFVSMLRADLSGSPAGFLFYLKYGKTISPEYIGIRAEYYPLGINQVLCWTAIQEGTREGYEYFDFGKSYVNQPGLLSHKTGWGAMEMDAPSFFYPPSKVKIGFKNQRLTYRILSELFKRMPLAVSKPAGRLLYQHLG
jgi:lipid II:glycine glycyltransferase (peptidoglycan interpeptide bridge formation enzyme)